MEFIDYKGSSRPSKNEKPLGSVYVYIYIHTYHGKSVSEKFKRLRNRYNITTIFKTKQILRSLVMKSKPERDKQQTAQYECGISFLGEPGRPLVARLHELGIISKKG
jgi:hypothetical protein